MENCCREIAGKSEIFKKTVMAAGEVGTPYHSAKLAFSDRKEVKIHSYVQQKTLKR